MRRNLKTTLALDACVTRNRLDTFLILIDYKFNEAFINGARFAFKDMYKEENSATSWLNLIALNSKKVKNPGEPVEHPASMIKPSQSRRSQDNHQTKTQLYFLMVKACNLLLSLFHNNQQLQMAPLTPPNQGKKKLVQSF